MVLDVDAQRYVGSPLQEPVGLGDGAGSVTGSVASVSARGMEHDAEHLITRGFGCRSRAKTRSAISTGRSECIVVRLMKLLARGKISHRPVFRVS